MSQNSNTQPHHGILRKSTIPSDSKGGGGSSQGASASLKTPPPDSTPRHSNCHIHYDELNIIQTHHPAGKDYGFMKIDEPKTPYYPPEETEKCAKDGKRSSLTPSGSKALDPALLSKILKDKGHEPPKTAGRDNAEAIAAIAHQYDEPVHSDAFEAQRKAHYKEYEAVKLARQLMEQEKIDDSSASSSSTTPTKTSSQNKK